MFVVPRGEAAGSAFDESEYLDSVLMSQRMLEGLNVQSVQWASAASLVGGKLIRHVSRRSFIMVPWIGGGCFEVHRSLADCFSPKVDDLSAIRRRFVDLMSSRESSSLDDAPMARRLVAG